MPRLGVQCSSPTGPLLFPKKSYLQIQETNVDLQRCGRWLVPPYVHRSPMLPISTSSAVMGT